MFKKEEKLIHKNCSFCQITSWGSFYRISLMKISVYDGINLINWFSMNINRRNEKKFLTLKCISHWWCIDCDHKSFKRDIKNWIENDTSLFRLIFFDINKQKFFNLVAIIIIESVKKEMNHSFAQKKDYRDQDNSNYL